MSAYPALPPEAMAELEVETMPPAVISPGSVTRFLAYTHHYTPTLLPGRRLSPGHLRRLAAWIGRPRPALRTVRRHQALAAHYALLVAASLVNNEGRRLVLGHRAVDWLHSRHEQQIESLRRPLLQPGTWTGILAQLGLAETIPVDYTVYLQQRLANIPRPDPLGERVAARLEFTAPEHWLLHLAPGLPSWLLFDVLQLGAWRPGEPLQLTSRSLSQAARRGYPLTLVAWLLEAATGRPLAEGRRRQLDQWRRHASTYSLATVHLLSVTQPEHLDRLLRQRRLRAGVIEQLSPRHVTISAGSIPAIQRWLARQGFELNGAQRSPAGEKSRPDEQACWLGLRLLVGLAELLPLPCPVPHAQLALVAEQIPVERAYELEAVAQQLLSGLREMIRGRDAFFPAYRLPGPALIAQIEEAIARQRKLSFTYQSPGDHEPRCRRVQPLRLEQRGGLYYLHAYCYRAEKNLVFRLDRLQELLS